MRTFDRLTLFAALLLAALGAAACNSARPGDFTPLGVAQGKATFLYLYAEN